MELVDIENKLVISQKILEDNKDKFYEIIRERLLKSLTKNQVLGLG